MKLFLYPTKKEEKNEAVIFNSGDLILQCRISLSPAKLSQTKRNKFVCAHIVFLLICHCAISSVTFPISIFQKQLLAVNILKAWRPGGGGGVHYTCLSFTRDLISQLGFLVEFLLGQYYRVSYV